MTRGCKQAGALRTDPTAWEYGVPEALVEVCGCGAEAAGPHTRLLHLHLPVGFVLLDRRRRPGAARSAQPQAVLDDDGLVPYVIDGMASQSLSTWLM